MCCTVDHHCMWYTYAFYYVTNSSKRNNALIHASVCSRRKNFQSKTHFFVFFSYIFYIAIQITHRNVDEWMNAEINKHHQRSTHKHALNLCAALRSEPKQSKILQKDNQIDE